MKRGALTLTMLFVVGFATITVAKQSQSVTFSHDGLTVHARMELPNGSGPFQVVIIIPGTGANDKDGTIPMYDSNVTCLYPDLETDTLRPYKGLSGALSDSGYAVLTYDKIEYTYPNPAPITFHKLWLPVENAITYVKTRTDIDLNNIIILGHSEGSSIAPYIAKKEPSVKAVISLAGPRTPLDSLLAYQLLDIARTCNGDTNAAKSQGAQVLSYFNDIRSGNYNASTPPVFGVKADVWSDYIKVVDSVSINYNLLNRATLFIGLGDDINVPVTSEYNRFKTEVANADFYSLQSLNHYLTTATDPSTSEVLTDTIVYWLRKNVFPVSVTNLDELQSSFILNKNSDALVITGSENIKEFYLINSVGTVVRKGTGESKKPLTVSLDGLPPANYYLKIIGSKTIKTFKVPM